MNGRYGCNTALEPGEITYFKKQKTAADYQREYRARKKAQREKNKLLNISQSTSTDPLADDKPKLKSKQRRKQPSAAYYREYRLRKKVERENMLCKNNSSSQVCLVNEPSTSADLPISEEPSEGYVDRSDKVKKRKSAAEYQREYRARKKSYRENILANNSVSNVPHFNEPPTSATVDVMPDHNSQIKKERVSLIKEEIGGYESMNSTVPLLPDDKGTIIKLEQEDDEIRPICKQEITIEENEFEVKLYNEQTNTEYNDQTIDEITEDHVEAYIYSMIDINKIKPAGGAGAGLSDAQAQYPNRGRRMRDVQVISESIVDSYAMFAEFIAPKLRLMRTAEDQIKMIKNIMHFFEHDNNIWSSEI